MVLRKKRAANCGNSGGKPASVKLKTLSSLVMIFGSLLLIADFFNVAKTYVGALVLGAGFLLSGMAQRQKNMEESTDDKKNARYNVCVWRVHHACGHCVFVFGSEINKKSL